LYGLKQTPKAWCEKIDHSFLNLDLKRCESYHSIYVLHVNGETLIVALYVDDLIMTRSNVNLSLDFNKHFTNRFEITNLGLLHFFFNIQVFQMDDGIFISQPKYALNLLKKFKMEDCKPCATSYQSRVKLSKECDSPKVDATLEGA
jgi:hypothetical protein